MTVQFWNRPEGCFIARYINEDKNDMVDLSGESHDEIWSSAEATALRGLGYRFNASWKHVPASSSTGGEL